MKRFLLILLAGYSAAAILGPIETLQETGEELNDEEKAGIEGVMEVGRIVKLAMHSFLANQTKQLESRIKEHIEDTCGPATTDPTSQEKAQVDLEGEVSSAIGDFSVKMSSAIQTFINELQMKFEAKVEESSRRTQEKGRQVTMPPGTFVRTKHTGGSTGKLISKAVQNHVKNLASRSDLQKQTEHFDRRLSNIQSQQESVIDQKILNYTKEIHRILFSFKPIYETFRQVVNTCDFREEQLYQMERFEQLLQELNVGQENNEDVFANIYSENVQDETQNPIQRNFDSGESLDELDDNNNQELPIGPMGECKDSEFLGSTLDMRVCSSVVRYNKCYIEVAAYHCCRSCTDAGLLPEVGPHRYLNLPRRISLFKALK